MNSVLVGEKMQNMIYDYSEHEKCGELLCQLLNFNGEYQAQLVLNFDGLLTKLRKLL
jgi:hypothetical protein